MISEILPKLMKSQGPAQVSLINTRVMLETGVNLRAVRPDQNNLATEMKIREVLRDMKISV
jgi:hypothetical protein